jgi:hypothetical protein
MTTNVKVFKSTDTGAPALTGQAGSLLALLDAVLLNGYNSGAITITRGGATATANRTGHGFQNGDCILHAGADQPEYNGEFYIFNVTADTYDFTVSGSPATPATGTITAKRAPAGWTKPFSGANKAAYRQGGGNQFYLRVDDTGTTTARVVGYEDMSDVDTGTAAFPTNAQVSGGLYWNKSNSSDGTARPWIIVANERLAILHVNGTSSATATDAAIMLFGDFKSYKVADAFATLIIGGISSTVTSNNVMRILSSAMTIPTAGHFVARSFTQIGGSLAITKHSDYVKSNNVTSMGGGGIAYPNGPDAGLYLAPLWITEVAGPHLRGEIVGLWNPLHQTPLQHGDTFQGAAGTPLAGRTFLALNMYSANQAMVEVSNTWEF